MAQEVLLPDCALDIAKHYEVPIEIIAAVAQKESGPKGHDVGKVGPNRNGTYDLGRMQINTWWLSESNSSNLRQWGIDERELLENECTNIAVGTWVLHTELHRYGDLTAALSAYNSGRPDSSVGLEYARRVLAIREKLKPAFAEYSQGMAAMEGLF